MQNTERRVYRCSFCRRAGHNRLTCDDPRLLDFELTCATQCQTLSEVEFYNWLSQTYNENDSNLLKTYAAKKTRTPTYQLNDITNCKYSITNYIYDTYRYSYNYSIYNDLSVQENYNLEIRMNTSLINDINSAYMFLDMINTTNLRRIEEQQLSRKFSISSILQEHDDTEECLDCCICFENYKKTEFVTLNCNHEFCNGCLQKSLQSDIREKPCCAYCRTEITTITSNTSKVYNEMANLIL